MRYQRPGPTLFRSFRLGVPRSFHDALQRESGSLVPICSKDLADCSHYHQYSDPERVRLSCSSCTIARPGLISVSIGVVAQHIEKGRGYESVTKIASSGASGKVGRESRDRVTQLDSALFFLRLRAVVLGTRRHSLEGRWQRAKQPLPSLVET